MRPLNNELQLDAIELVGARCDPRFKIHKLGTQSRQPIPPRIDMLPPSSETILRLATGDQSLRHNKR